VPDYFCCKNTQFDENNTGIIMVFILHRYIFRELFKVFALSAMALGVIMSLGSLLRPIQEYGVGPKQVLDLLYYFMPITFTFVLPVAALFATSLVYGRIAADNEFDACKASGISPAMLFYPGLVLAIIVSIANLVLSFHVVPIYVHRAESAMKADAKQILFRNIQRQGYYCLPGGQFRIYADAVDIKNSGLLGVVIIDTDKVREKKLITAESATVNFDSTAKNNEVKVFARNAFQFDEHGGAFFKAISVLGEFESLMADNVKFRKIDQMNAIKASPITYYPIAVVAWGAYEQLTTEMLCRDINDIISSETNNFYQLYNDESLVRFTGEKCVLKADQGTIEIIGKVILFEYNKNNGELSKSYRGEKLVLQLSTETETRPSTKIVLTFPNAVWLDSGIEYMKPRYVAKDLALPDSIAAKLGENVIDTAENYRYLAAPSPRLKSLIEEMKRKIRVTLFEIKAEIHSRLVFGIGCITLILIGIELGIKYRGGHLLTAFGLSSIPAAALLVFIMAGKNITRNRYLQLGADFGVAFMWIGLLILSIIAVILYRKILRN
jgi:lipopolysaccharide export LptBFGC system permease protein LptF